MTRRATWLSKTTGGLQLWTDLHFRAGYRIQRHALRHFHRLLDPHNHRIAQGTWDTCLTVLETIHPQREWEQCHDHFVILIHGLIRTGHCMTRLKKAVWQQGIGHATHFSYASTRASLMDHARALKQFIESLPPQASFAFVCHSMGNIVLRTALGLWRLPEQNPLNVPARMKSVVMLAPPNQGASIARMLGRTGLFGLIAGPGADQLGLRWAEVSSLLAVPPCPFAILAGESRVQNPLIERPNDLLVSVSETQLNGAEQFHRLPIAHGTLMTDPEAMALTLQFLQTHR